MNMPSHLSLTAKPVPETVTNGDDELPPSLGDVSVDRAKTGTRRDNGQRARAASRGEGYMPVPVRDQAAGARVVPIIRPLVGSRGRVTHRSRTWESKKPMTV